MPQESLAAWAATVPGQGILASGPLTGIIQNILRAEITAVISAVGWIRNKIGCLHIWCDSQDVVNVFRALQSGQAVPSDFEHQDLWIEMDRLLKEATADIIITKVFSHDLEANSESPLEDFCRINNGIADHQADLANCSRPDYFDRIWQRYVSYRRVWKQRVGWYVRFVADIASQDCIAIREAEDVCTDDFHFPTFETSPNRAVVAQTLDSFQGRDAFDLSMCSQAFVTAFHRLRQWLSDIDHLASTSRPVNLIEIYVGCRIFSWPAGQSSVPPGGWQPRLCARELRGGGSGDGESESRVEG
eukprot:Skav221626  [mRNA]  locus=scaffold4037:37659:39267:+ [translate_table: standard]